jgi:hypothetical protein
MTEHEARQELINVIGRPRSVDVTSELWVAAAVLGGLRQACNDAIRSEHRDRGAVKNATGDVQGCFGELLVACLIEREMPDAIVTVAPLNWDRPGDDVDAAVEIDGHTFLVETKCHLHETSKRRFLINAVAVDRSKARGALSFVPILSIAGAGRALVGRPLLINDVLGWPVVDFRYGDPARTAWLEEVVSERFDLPLDLALKQVREVDAVADRDDLRAAATSARARFFELRSKGLRLEGGPLATLKALVAVA